MKRKCAKIFLIMIPVVVLAIIIGVKFYGNTEQGIIKATYK